ncbi:nicotinate-nucleotide adenylyltransferase [Svornostia abyssi]|uniref:Probable nicotinate-nucleotide adenylyltransferase n=1 Tax=Svornostia abyssi TaxID=2898438 RepID=A0ABY5PEA3_9ACTN|nr:nicotinate-nucleotide adenylyltransferase [Parviterribacteraceae bacterium J379]
MRLGVLGGTFNPPHLAHLLCASEAADQLGLERVLLVPAFEPPHKEVAHDPGPEARAALCELAVADDPRLEVSRIELERAGRSYTVDTLRALHATHANTELTFIVGGDMALSLPTWREPVSILGLARLAVAERSGVARQDILDRLGATLGDVAGRIDFFEMPRLDLSSSEIRRRITDGRTVRYLVPDAVADRISARGLYRGGGR